MKLYDLSLIFMIGVIAIAGIVGYVSNIYLGNNNPIEQSAEKLIQDETGITVNFDK